MNEEKRGVNTPEPVPFAVWECDKAHNQNTVHWLVKIIIVLIIALVGTNVGWLLYMSQYDYVSDTYTQDGSGVNLISGRDLDYGPNLQNQS